MSSSEWQPQEPASASFGRRDLPDVEHGRRRVALTWSQRWLVIAALAGSLALIALALCVFVLPDRIVQAPSGLSELHGADRVQAETALEQTRNNVRGTLVQAVGGCLLLLTFAVGFGQVIVARQGQLVDRFTKTIEQLGSNEVDVRLGAIYALQQIAHRREYARPVAEILVAYLKTAGEREEDGTVERRTRPVFGTGARGQPLRLAPDLQAALRILVKEELWATAVGRRLDLSYIAVPGADLDGADLTGVVLLHAVLDGASLQGAHLRSADLRCVSMRGANLTGADLSRSDLSAATLDGATLTAAHLDDTLLVHASCVGTTLLRAHLRFADLTNADLRRATLNGADLANAVLADATLHDVDLAGATLTDVRRIDSAALARVDLTAADIDPDTRQAISEALLEPGTSAS